MTARVQVDGPRRQRTPDEITGSCEMCHKTFRYAAKLPRQRICAVCFYESKGDLTGAREEEIFRFGFEAGYARCERLYVEDAERRARAAA